MVKSAVTELHKKVLNAHVTNGDKYRMMNDTELARLLSKFDNLEDVLHYCRNKPECNAIVQAGGAVPEKECRKCLTAWLRAPAYDKAYAEPEVSEADRIMQMYGILEEHCLLRLETDTECSSSAPDCTYCLAQYLVKRDVTVG